VSAVPLTDARRAKALRAALAQMAPTLAPEWAGLGQEGDFGAALYEIAARFAEHSTRRLDLTALRDKLAFLDTLDIAAPAPRSATVPIVFVLAEKRSEPVYAPPRVQIAAAVDDQPVIFETREAIAITPARPIRLIAADPGADRIELAPPKVISAPQASPPSVTYRLVSAAEPGGTMLQLAQAVGLDAGDLLRIAGTAYRIAKRSGEIVTLLDRLEAPVPAGAAIEKVTRLDAFALRNLSEHHAFIGHKELLKLDGAATIALRLDPPSLARRLSRLDIAYELWGKPKDADTAGWQTLRLLGGRDGELRLSKDWEGAVEEVEAEGRKSRWIRLRLLTAISDAAPPDTRAASVAIKVNSNAPAATQSKERSSSIVSAFYNGQPLPLTTTFLPFGPEPQRFDTFAIAAPEALSKKQASVTLDVTLSDASLEAMALAAGNNTHVYGLGHNQRLQAIRFQAGEGSWRQLEFSAAAATASAAKGWLPMKRRTPLYALSVASDPALDLVFGFDRNHLLRAARIRTSNETWSIEAWQEFPAAADTSFQNFCLVASATPERPSQLIAVDSKRVFRRTIDAAGSVSPDWKPLSVVPGPGIGDLPDLSNPIALAPAQTSRDAAVFVLIDSAGNIFRGDVITASDSISWQKLPIPAGQRADPQIRPAGMLDGDGKLVVVAARQGSDRLIAVHEVDGELPLPPGQTENVVGKPVSILLLPEVQDSASRLPLTVVTGSSGYLVWSYADAGEAHPMPSDVDPDGIHNALLLPGSADEVPTLLLNASKELLLRTRIQPLMLQVKATRHDMVRCSAGAPFPSHVLINTAPPKLLSLPGPWLTFNDERTHPLALATLKADLGYTMLAEQSGDLAGTRDSSARALFLADSDKVTATGDFLRIEGKMYEVAAITDKHLQRTATLDRTIPGTTRKYMVYEPTGETDEDGKILVRPVSDLHDGTRITGKADKLILEVADQDSTKGRYLKVADEFYEVVEIATETIPAKATLDRDIPGNASSYRVFRPTEPQRIVAKADLGTLVNLGTTAVPAEATGLSYPADAAPAVQSLKRPAQPAADGESWLLLGSAWTKAPAGSDATLVGKSSIGIWTQIRLPRSSGTPELSWEYFDGRGWKRLEREFRDGTGNLASSGEISFVVPNDLDATDVAGKTDYWIRARLVGGDYGRPAYVVDTTPPDRQSISIDRSTVNPPEIVSIEASYKLETYTPPQLVLTVNNLAAVDQTQAAAAAGAEFDLFEGLAAHTGDAAGLGRAVYLCLSRAPGVDPLSLYVDATDMDAPALRLQAEVLRPQGWAPIVCDDETRGLARPGLLRLFLSTAPAQLPLFGCAGWWLRLRPMVPTSVWAPIVHGLYLNAVTAEQAKSLRQEIVGSSLGAPDQSYRLAEAPVLPETLELRVRESLGDEEKAALRSLDPGAIASFDDVEGEWTRWCATDSFVDKGGGARVFRLDPATGEVRFGNGRDGKIPPAGRDAIRAVGYQAGGGSRGNVPAFAVNQLKTALESVELAVNPVDAGGGADAPPTGRLAETAPARLRHATRALAPPDIEALATGSSPDVVRARCLRGRGCGIDLVVAIRKGGERCPVPSRARREGIARNVAAAGWGALAPEAIRVRAPRYVHIRVEAVVIARSVEGVAQVENDVRSAIVKFLHPMDGGPRGLGWPFGRRPWPSDVQRVAAAVAGVDRVVDVVIAARDAGAALDRLQPDAMVCAVEEDISLTVQPPRSAR